MARIRTVVLSMEVCVSKKANNSCARDRKNHPVPRGATWLKISDAGANSSAKHYCIPCAMEILTEAKATIEALLAGINAAHTTSE